MLSPPQIFVDVKTQVLAVFHSFQVELRRYGDFLWTVDFSIRRGKYHEVCFQTIEDHLAVSEEFQNRVHVIFHRFLDHCSIVVDLNEHGIIGTLKMFTGNFDRPDCVYENKKQQRS